ncbi:hypothetical protein PybrP1_010960 [[Pythium] brassicae (nom. inval.)]|nr:hypothetical protein PybrP1_010960 [[Pythium] brassicae (nom. inval.)]
MAPSFISLLAKGDHAPGATTASAAGTTTTTATTTTTGTAPTAGATPTRSLPPGFAGTGFGAGGFAGLGASPMRSNLGLPMGLQMPRSFPNAATGAAGASAARTSPMIPMIPNLKRQASSKEPSAAPPSDSRSDSASTSASTSASSSASGSPVSPPAGGGGAKSWNDAEKMQDFFLHIKGPENFAQAENKLINIRELVAKNASPLERFAADHPAQDFSVQDTAAAVAAAPVPTPATPLVAAPPQTRAQAHGALADMLAARSGGAGGGTPKPQPPSNQDDNHRRPAAPLQTGSIRGNVLAETLAKRGRGSAQQEPQAPPAKPQAPPSGDARGNMLGEMLARRGGGGDAGDNQATTPVAAPAKPIAGGDARSNLLGEMLAQRGGGSGSGAGSATKDAAKPKKSNPIADMLAKRAAPSSEPKKSNPIADMLAKRAGPTSQPKGDASPDSKSSNPLAAMLKRRFATKPEAEAAAVAAGASNPQEPQKEAESAANADVPLKDDPQYGKYFTMLKIGHPAPVVKHRMQRDGVDPAVLDLDPTKPLPASGDSEAERVFREQLAEYNDKIGKYSQMLKVGLPRPVVEHKMQMEGVNPSWLNGPPTKPTAPAAPAAPTEEEIAAHRAKYEKYFGMLRMGLPRGAVEHKMIMAGIDPKELDGPHPTAATPATKPAAPPAPSFKRPNSIRKKIHWEVKRAAPAHQRSGSRDSLWTFAESLESMDEIQISRESKEMLEKLFVKTISDATKKPAKPSAAAAAESDDAAKKKPPLVVLIDMKKSQNIAITLARVKLGFPELKREILAMNPTVLSTAQLQSLMDMWPDRTEQEAVDNYHGDMALLGTTEKFLVETRNIPRFKEKLACLVFKQEFPGRLHELRESINLVIRGAHQVCESLALRQLFMYILQIGNLLNFGADGPAAAAGGFSLSSLVKLSQTKAFVGGITFLQYVVQSIERDVPHLARFYEQINLIAKCSKVSMSVVLAEKKSLDDGLRMLQHEAQVAVPTDDPDAQLATSILQHFATEVEHDLEALDSLLQQMEGSKAHFLEYFEEEETGEELDVLFSHIANFIVEFRREHKKFVEAARQEKLKALKQQAQAARHSLSASPAARPPPHHQTRQARHSHNGRVETQPPAQSTAGDEARAPLQTRQARHSHSTAGGGTHSGLMERGHHGLVELRAPAQSSTSGAAHSPPAKSPHRSAASFAGPRAPAAAVLNSTSVRGDVAPDAVALVLPHEYVLHRIALGPAASAAGLRSEDLRELRVAPAALDGQNLVLEKEDDAFRELEALKALTATGQTLVVVDVTVPSEGRDEFMAKRARLAERLGVHIVTVATCDVIAASAGFPLGLAPLEKGERLAKALETELVFGFGAADTTAARYCPGAIYQQVHAASPALSADGSVVAHAIALVQQRTTAPVYLSFSLATDDSGGNSGGPQRETEHQQLVLNWLRVLLAHGVDSAKIVVCHADQWCETEEAAGGTPYGFLRSVLQLGVRLLFTMVGLAAVSDAIMINPRLAGVPSRAAVLAPTAREPPRDSSIARCIAWLIRDKDASVRQLLLSTNIQQRVQYLRHGGGGYAFLFSHFRERLARYGVTDRHFQQLVRTNPVELLGWYTPPVAAAVPKEFLRCSICSRDFEPVVGEYFTKFEFIYCGTKCLRKHSRQGFAKLPLLG